MKILTLVLALTLSTTAIAANNTVDPKAKAASDAYNQCMITAKLPPPKDGKIDVVDAFFSSIGDCDDKAMKLKKIIGAKDLFILQSLMFSGFLAKMHEIIDQQQLPKTGT